VGLAYHNTNIGIMAMASMRPSTRALRARLRMRWNTAA